MFEWWNEEELIIVIIASTVFTAWIIGLVLAWILKKYKGDKKPIKR